jgi:hemerythrin-like domain-containing protein
MSEIQLPNIGADLARIHAIITRGLAVAIEKSATFYREGYPDATTRQGFVDYVRSLVATTHGHHITEDDLAFPYFSKLLPDAPWEALTVQHGEMQVLLDEIGAAVDALAADAEGIEGLPALQQPLERLAALWHPHIAVEEAHLSVEAGAELVSVEEQIRLAQAFAKHSQEHAGPDFLVVPFMLFNLSQEERAALAGQMPPVLTQQLVPAVWKDKWAAMKPFLLD